MIAKPTTLILGAGSSSHLTYPIGSGLRNQIIEFLRGGVVKNVFKNENLPDPSKAQEFYQEFADSLSMGGWTSPDAFLEKHDKFLDVGKTLIAAALKAYELPHLLFPARDWHEHLLASLTEDTLQDFRKNRLSIITYNYDRTVDTLLHKFVQ